MVQKGAFFAKVIDRDDVGMIERSDPLRLGAETLHVVRARLKARQATP